MKKWTPLIILSSAAFMMSLDGAVLSVSIAQLVTDFNTTVLNIQAVVTYSFLIMASLMLVGGKLGDIYGRRRAFAAGLALFTIGALVAATSQSVATLNIGFAALKGIGGALMFPAIVALLGSTYSGKDRAVAFGAFGGISGAGGTIGLILGGWVTTNLSWRYIYWGELVIGIVLLLLVRQIKDTQQEGARPKLDWIGGILSAIGFGLVVYGILQSSVWGLITSVNSPIELFGLSLTPFIVGAGLLVLFFFINWEERRLSRSEEIPGKETEVPLVRLTIFENRSVSGVMVATLLQSVIVGGITFGIPLYLQVVIGLNAFETGLRLLPFTLAMLVTAMGLSGYLRQYAPRLIIRFGFSGMLLGSIIILFALDSDLRGYALALGLGLIGVGLGFLAATLGNLVQSSVIDRDRSEAGATENTMAKLGSSLGVAIIGSIVITGLASAFQTQIVDDPRLSVEIAQESELALSKGLSFMPTAQLEAILEKSDPPPPPGISAALIEGYEASQVQALQLGFIVVGFVAIVALLSTALLPPTKLEEAG